MKSNVENFHLLFVALCCVTCLLVFPLSGLGQFSVVSITPANGTVQIDTTITLEISFSAPVDTSARFPEPGDFYLDLIISPDSLVAEPDSITLSADRKTVRAHNLGLQPETRYVFGVLAAQSESGESLDLPSVVTFTTGDSLPSGRVSGTVSYPDGDPRGTVVVLFEKLMDEDPVAAAVVDLSSGEYTIDYVGTGVYFPLAAKDISGNGEPNFIEEGDPVGLYDPDKNTVPDSVSIDEGQTLTGVDFELAALETQTAAQYKARVEALVLSAVSDAALLAVFSNSLQSDGTSSLWMYVFYSAGSSRSVFALSSNLFTILEINDEWMTEIQPLPQEWIDSDVAADTAQIHGGGEFLTTHDDVEMEAMLHVLDLDPPWVPSTTGSTVNKKVLGKSLTFMRKTETSSDRLIRRQSGVLSASALDNPVAWVIQYRAEEIGDELMIFVDAVTGEYMDNPFAPAVTTARFNFPAAEAAAKSWAEDAGLLIVGTHQSDINPDGEALMWFFAYHSPHLDSIRAFFVLDGKSMGSRILDWEPPSRDVLPAGWIDSDAALDSAEVHGGTVYRQTNNGVWVSGGVSRGMCPTQPMRAVWYFRYESMSDKPLTVILDAVTGEFLPETPVTNITAQTRLQDVVQTAEQWAADAVLTSIGPTQPMEADGTSLGWVYIFYSNMAGVRVFYAAAQGPISSEVPTGSPASTEALPSGWIDSDKAAQVAEANGGQDYRENTSDVIVVAGVSRNVLGYYGRPSRAVWKFMYSSTSRSHLFIYVDAVTGEYISQSDPVQTTARYNLEAAVHVAGIFSDHAELVYVMNNVGSLTEAGESDGWLFAFYSPGADTFRSYQIMSGHPVYVWRNESGLGSRDELPENWIDSNAAVAVAESHGGSQFRENFPDADVSCLLSRNVPSETMPVSSDPVWLFNYISAAADSHLVIRIHAVSGEIINPETEIGDRSPSNELPTSYALLQNYPNPFNPETIIEYRLPRGSEVELAVYNLAGQKIVALFKGRQVPGNHIVTWNGRDEFAQPVSSGVYLYQLRAGDYVAVKKLMLLR